MKTPQQIAKLIDLRKEAERLSKRLGENDSGSAQDQIDLDNLARQLQEYKVEAFLNNYDYSLDSIHPIYGTLDI
jgi:hypothetical protein